MLVLLLICGLIMLVFCFGTKTKRRGFLRFITDLLYFPLGVIFALAKKYK